jgi:nicotinate-nucleotide pyrophosphorylase (carboxylating)
MHQLPDILLRPIVEAALREDIRSGDITTQSLIPAELQARAVMRMREDAVVCGTALAQAAFMALDQNLEITVLRHDGERVQKGETFLEVKGSARAVLTWRTRGTQLSCSV